MKKKYFSENRINRNNNYAEQIEVYEELLKATSINVEQKNFAQTEIKRINDEKNAISIAENLIKLKGIEEAVILINKDNLDDAEVAQIQNIIQNELGVEAKNIHINSVN